MADMNINFEALLKKKDVLVVAGVVVLALLVARNIYGRQMRHYASMKELISAEKDKGATLERIIVLNEKIKKMKSKSWASTDMNFIIDKIYNIGLEVKVKIKDISFGDRVDNTNFLTVPIGFACEAPYKSLVLFMKKMETYPMAIRIKALSLGPTESSTSRRDPVLRAAFSIEVVYLK
jgi:Tfp pilus assembly protein PilO